LYPYGLDRAPASLEHASAGNDASSLEVGVARLKIAYIGGGSTRAAGTMASFIEQGENFAGSEIALIDLDGERLELIRALARRMAAAKGADITVSATTDRRAGLDGCDAVLTSYRPGGFEARVLDERIPLAHGVIGQETQGPGGFFMALRSIHQMRAILDDIAVACPGTRIFNYTNPVNIVAQAVTDHSDVPFVSLCEGPIVFPAEMAEAAGLDPELLDVVSIGLNHGSWSVHASYDGRDLVPLLAAAYERRADDPELRPQTRRMLRLASVMGALPSEYFQYYYFEDEVLGELRAKPTTRAEDILGWVPGYWSHYEDQAASDAPALDPRRSRGGIHELELAIDCMDAVFNDRGETLPVNVPCAGTIPGFPDTLVVETLGRCDAGGVTPLPLPGLPAHLRGLVEALGEYQQAAADAAWSGDARDALRALAAHPLVRSIDLAEKLYGELAAAHREHLPDRLLPA
jgi:6-phospho-beta-glucosidase